MSLRQGWLFVVAERVQFLGLISSICSTLRKTRKLKRCVCALPLNLNEVAELQELNT